MQSAEHFNNIGINRRDDGESWADSEAGNVHEASAAGGGLHRVHESRIDYLSAEADITPSELGLIQDFHDGRWADGDLPNGLA